MSACFARTLNGLPYLHHSEGAQLVALVQPHRIEPDTYGMAGWLRQIGRAKFEFAFGLAILTSPATLLRG